MAELAELKPDAVVRGLLADGPVTVVATALAGSDAVRLVYRTVDGSVHEQLVYRFQERELSVSAPEAVRPFDADGRLFRLAAEARRIQLAYLFDHRLAVHLSRVYSVARRGLDDHSATL